MSRIGNIFGLLMGAGINTNGMSPEEAYITWNELQNKAKIGTPAEKAKLKREYGIDLDKIEQKSNLTNEEKRLQELTGEKVKKELTDEEKKNRKQKRHEKNKRKKRQWTEEERQVWNAENKELKKILQNHPPITIQIDGRKVQAHFDKFTAKKNIYKACKSDEQGFEWKRKHMQYIGKLIEKSKYWTTDEERGNKLDKNGNVKEAHRGVKWWHYLRLKLRDRKAKFDMLVNIREKNNNFYIYEIAITQRENKKREFK